MPKHVVTAEDIARAHKLRADRVPWYSVARELGIKEYRLRKAMDAQWAVRRQEQIARQRQAITGGPRRGLVAKLEASNPTYDPRRDGYREYRSPFAEMLGEPPIGRSALDRRA